jgi:Tfp pilus assembly protein PilN
MARFEFIPAKDYDGLLRQANAMAMLIRSMEKQRSFQNVKIGDMARELAVHGFEEIDAQRDINARLTDEILKLEKRIEALQARNDSAT